MIAFAGTSFAASAEIVVDGKKTVPPNTIISLPISLKTAEKFNAFTLDINVVNAALEESPHNDKIWTAINGPTITDGSLTFTGAVLGENKYYSGKKELLIVKIKTPAEGEVTLSTKATIALMDTTASKLEATPLEIKLTVSADATTANLKENVTGVLSDFTKNPIALYSAIGTAVVLLVIILFVVFRRRKN